MKFFHLTVLLCLSLPLSAQQTVPSETNLGLHYALLNDTSGKTLWPRGIEQQVNLARRFLKQVVKPGSDVGSLVNFAEEFFIDVQNSTNPDAMNAKLIHEGRGATRVFDAVVATANWLDKYQFPDTRKAIFLFSDGDDNASKTSLQKTIATAQSVHVPIFVIAPAAVQHKRQGKDMDKLASATGGRAYFVPGSGDFDFAALKHDLGR